MTDAVDVFIATVRTGRDPSQQETGAVLRVVHRWLGRRLLDPRDREEVAADAVLRLITAVRADRLDPARPAGAWLRVVADNLAFDRGRRQRPTTTEFEEHVHAQMLSDDHLVALLDESAAAADVSRALRAAHDAGEYELVRTITTWLSLAEADGEAPSSRRVAERMGNSHMTVQRALRAFGERLRRERVPSGGPNP